MPPRATCTSAWDCSSAATRCSASGQRCPAGNQPLFHKLFLGLACLPVYDSPPEEERMPNYLLQVAYSREGWEALVKQPQNRIEAVTPAIEKLGGKVKHAWFSFGDHDVVLITEMPDNVSAAAIAMAFAGGGACKS